MGALAISDHGNLHGWLDHYEHCKEQGIKPLLGLEGYQARKTRWDRDPEERAGPSKNEWDQRGPYHIGLIARNLQGYHNIIKLSSYAFLDGYYGKPRLDMELLDRYSEGVIVLSGCLNGAVQQALLRGDNRAALEWAATMQEIVGKENYFIELQDHGIEEQHRVMNHTLHIAKTIGAPVVATGDCHYVLKEDSKNHDVMLCTQTKTNIHDPNRFSFVPEQFFLHSYEEMLKKFKPEWLANTCMVAEMCDVELEFNELHFPEFPDVPKDKTPEQLFEKQVWAGLYDRYGATLPQEVLDRAKYELGVVKRMGFVEYFLVVGDLVRWAKANKIRVGPGRGSAAASILSYALKITNLDPIKYGLIFERFLIEGRLSMPDFDLDIDDRYRDRVIEYAKEKYGHDKVAQICNYMSIGARTAIRDACRSLGYEYEVADKISKLMPPIVLGVSKTIEESLESSPELLMLYETDDVAHEIIDAAKGLEGAWRHTSIHAAGVIITPKPVMDYIPVMRKGEGEPIITQWDYRRVEQVGTLKIDCLALRNLSVIDMAVENILKGHDVYVDMDEINLEDHDIYDELSRGDTMGVFQIESPGMAEMTAAIKPDKIEDLMAIQSLYRPGPMGSGMDKMFINRRHGRESYSVPHPILEDILKPSHGIMLYQEDVLNTTRAITKWDAGEADTLRKVIGKKLMKKVGEYREKFVKDATKNNIDSKVADKIYSDIEYFAGYGFNRAHAAGYSVICYMTAWLRHYYPAEYMAACLTSTAGSKNRLVKYLNYCKKVGIGVIPPSVDLSQSEFAVDGGGSIVFGLSAIEGIAEKIIDPLLSSRPEGGFKNMYGFLRNVDNAVLNKSVIEHLMRAGALDTLIWFDPKVSLNRERTLEMLNEERKEVGLYVTEHPLDDLYAYLEPNVTHTIADLETAQPNAFVKLGGMISKVTKKTTKAGKTMFILDFEDLTGTVTSLVFPTTAAKTDVSVLEDGALGIMAGRVMKEESEDEDAVFVKLAFAGFDRLTDTQMSFSPPIMLKTETRLTNQQIGRISDIIETSKGTSHVFLEMREGDHVVTFKFKKAASHDIKETLQQIVDLSEVTNG